MSTKGLLGSVSPPPLRELPHHVFAPAIVRGIGCYEMANPTKHSRACYPESRGHDEPENSSQEISIVDLPDTGNEKTQYSSYSRLIHQFCLHAGSELMRKYLL